jgi:hypothetical protein
MLFSTTFTIFLSINHLHSTFALPTGSNGGVAAVQSLNQTYSLAKRDYVPPDQKCDHADHWLGRRCLPGTSDRAWEDSCLDRDIIRAYWIVDYCPENTMCMNTLGPPENYPEIILCIFRPIVESNSTQNQQTGVYQVGNVGLGNAEHTVSVSIKEGISDATVAAYLEGM